MEALFKTTPFTFSSPQTPCACSSSLPAPKSDYIFNLSVSTTCTGSPEAPRIPESCCKPGKRTSSHHHIKRQPPHQIRCPAEPSLRPRRRRHPRHATPLAASSKSSTHGTPRRRRRRGSSAWAPCPRTTCSHGRRS